MENQNPKDVSPILSSIVIITALFLLTALLIPNTSTGSREKARRIMCANNLKNIGLALKNYADENDGLYPVQGAAPNQGFNQLITGEYLNITKTYICRSSEKTVATGEGTLSKPVPDIENCYLYLPGPYSEIKEEEYNLKIGMVRDQNGNHKEYGNILFGDGHVKGYQGKSWWENPEVEWKK